MEKATDLRGVYRHFSAKPIPIDLLDALYVPATEGRESTTTI